MSRALQVAWMVGLFCVGSAVAAAAENEGITVVGIGKVDARPTIVEMSGTVQGDAELAGDAVTKYHGNRQAAIDAIGALGIEGLTIDGGGIAIKSEMNEAQMQAMRRGMPAPAGSNKLSVSEPLKLRLTGVDQMDTEQLLETIVRIVDAGKDAGVIIGPKLDYNPYYGYQGNTSGALATFKLENVDGFKSQAYEKAIADARKQATRLAELAGVKLGRVTGIREGAIPQSNTRQQIVYAYPGMVNQEEDDTFTATDLKDITVSIVLQVDFAIEE
jgi:uncharacterized protein YggE